MENAGVDKYIPDNLRTDLKPYLKKAVSLATVGTDAAWKKVGKLIPLLALCEEFRRWARDNLKNPNENLQNLALTILEKTKTSLSEKVRNQIIEILNNKNTPKYCVFRAACALASHPQGYSENIQEKVKEVLLHNWPNKASDVGPVAKQYYLSMEE